MLQLQHQWSLLPQPLQVPQAWVQEQEAQVSISSFEVLQEYEGELQ